jgi:hypothetical protein
MFFNKEGSKDVDSFALGALAFVCAVNYLYWYQLRNAQSGENDR